ncbi:MFS transporter [Thioclava litoralis]|uniref:MFS transporter n=1 Tax=Thioclava litoralis TaxID=3076557 RepID=A0ABZ1DWL5_9RHOB|nr:MFS transporter [Thioclava sp. FTW29]
MSETPHLHIPGVNPNPRDPSPKEQRPPPPFEPKPRLHVLGYVTASICVAIAMSLSQGFVTANSQRIAGDLGASQTEALWLTAAYMIPRASLSLMLVKLRTQYGLRNFAILSVACFALINFATLWVDGLHSAIVVEFFAGCASAPLASVAVLYMLEIMPLPKKTTLGLPLVMTFILVGTPLAYAISPSLYHHFNFLSLRQMEFGLSLLMIALIYILPLSPMPRAPVISVMDVLTFGLLAIGFGSIVVLFFWGTTVWWTDATWLGGVAALAVTCLTAFVAIELKRERPLIDLRWLASWPILRLAAALFLMRMLLSEQTVGIPRLLNTLGYSNDQEQLLFLIVTIATISGGIVCALTFKMERMPEMHMAALAMMAVGLAMDTRVTAQYGPQQFFLSQAMLGFASTIFLPTAMANGVMSAFKRSPNYLLSFIAVFLASQSLGAVIGSGVFRSMVQLRTNLHTQLLNEQLRDGAPIVTSTMTQLKALYATTSADPTIIKAEALTALSNSVSVQANVLAYADAFRALNYLALATLACLILHYLWTKRQERLQTQTA